MTNTQRHDIAEAAALRYAQDMASGWDGERAAILTLYEEAVDKALNAIATVTDMEAAQRIAASALAWG